MLVWAACAGPGDQVIVTPRKIADAKGAPAITAIVDLGDIARLPEPSSPLPAPDSDGRFIVGELIHIQGQHFGKQPTLEIGGRPAAVIARTGAGGIIARLPVGVRAGTRPVKVQNGRGQAEKEILVERYAVVLQPESGAGDGTLHILSVDQAGMLAPRSTIAVPGARDVAFSPDGQLALVVVSAAEELPKVSRRSSAHIALVSMVTSGGPKQVHELSIGAAAPARIAVSSPGPGQPGLAAVSTEDSIILVRMDDARHPAAYKPVAVLADRNERIVDLDISPDGKTVMALLQASNSLLPIDTSAPAKPRPGAAVVFSDDRVPLGASLAFDRTGERLYLVTGDNPRSMATGTHPTRVVEFTPEPGGWRMTRSVPLERAGAPTALVFHAAADPSAAGRELDVLVSTIDRSWLAEENAEHSSAATPGRLTRALFEGESQELLAEQSFIGGAAVGPSFIAVAVVRASGQGRKLGMTILPKQGGTGRFVELGPAAVVAPERIPMVALQP